MSSDAITSELLDADEAASYLGMAVATLAAWRSSNRYALAFVKIGRRVKYRRADLDRFIELQTVRPHGDE